MPKKKSTLVGLSFILLAGLAYVSFTQIYRGYAMSELQQTPLNLQVIPLQQLRGTSCGEAVITMVYNYAHPQTPISEQDVITYATEQGYFTETVSPYTSPADMVRIAEHYAEAVSTGHVVSSRQGLSLLIQKLRKGEPVIIDVLSDFADPESEAHFIVVTGLSVDTSRENAVVIYYNDPLTGTAESADWESNEGIWNAWKNNLDPGGPGWWMVISPP
jgi:hypothetical protein